MALPAGRGGQWLLWLLIALPGLSLALMALMLALATNIGVGTMVSSFRQTFVGWLDQRLVSEFYEGCCQYLLLVLSLLKSRRCYL